MYGCVILAGVNWAVVTVASLSVVLALLWGWWNYRLGVSEGVRMGVERASDYMDRLLKELGVTPGEFAEASMHVLVDISAKRGVTELEKMWKQ